MAVALETKLRRPSLRGKSKKQIYSQNAKLKYEKIEQVARGQKELSGEIPFTRKEATRLSQNTRV